MPYTREVHILPFVAGIIFASAYSAPENSQSGASKPVSLSTAGILKNSSCGSELDIQGKMIEFALNVWNIYRSTDLSKPGINYFALFLKICSEVTQTGNDKPFRQPALDRTQCSRIFMNNAA